MTRTDRPPVSVMFMTYQQAPYVRAALRSVLALDYPSLDLLVSDDASEDGTFDIVRDEIATYRGPRAVDAAAPEHAACMALASAITGALLQSVQTWSTQRCRLWHQRLRPTWAPLAAP